MGKKEVSSYTTSHVSFRLQISLGIGKLLKLKRGGGLEIDPGRRKIS
jgi:hypothetical protein